MSRHEIDLQQRAAGLALSAGENCLGRLIFPTGWRYMLMLRRDPDGHPLKPMAFAGVDQLARHIHRARAGGELQLLEAPIQMCGEDDGRPGVSITVQAYTDAPRRFLGWAYINGAGRLTLEAALRLAQPGPDL